jgi:L-galactose dehydrogenase/L-glyceraldehyde 3-phosphate reductase
VSIEQRVLGRTGLSVSALGFGCGFVGGVLVRGTPAEQERAVARALELGISYFDTAAYYGDSEVNLGRILANLHASPVVGSKVMAKPGSGDIAASIVESVEASLRRLRRERIDLMQLHNVVGVADDPQYAAHSLTPEQVLHEALPALERLREKGRIGWIGMTCIGRTAALRTLVESGRFDSAQIVYNLLNPSAHVRVPAGFPAQDYQRLMDSARLQGAGVIGIRVLAGGALSGAEGRHPNANPEVAPIGSGPSYGQDLADARRFAPLMAEGLARYPAEAAMRYALSNPDIGTAVIGFSSVEHIEEAAAAAEAGPLTTAALERCRSIQLSFAHRPG